MINKTILLCEELINKDEHNVIALSGPSPSGKSTIVRGLKAKFGSDLQVFTTESFVLKFFEFYHKGNNQESIKAFENTLSKNGVIVVEDIDLFRNKECIQEEIATLINNLHKTTFIITGIDLKERLPKLLQGSEIKAKLYYINLPPIN